MMEHVCRENTYTSSLTADEISRYSRQLVLPQFGVERQDRLRRTSVLMVGAGGLGCSAGIHLAGSGVGQLTIVDHDRIETSNLHRQILYRNDDVGRFKAEVLAESCARLNPLMRVPPVALCKALTTLNCLELVRNHAVILDCTDNVYARYLLNDACVLSGKALVSASALKFDGQLTVYNYQGNVCRRCLFPDPIVLQGQSCGDNGVMGPVPGIMGSLQAMEAIKLATDMTVSFAGVQLHYDSLNGSFYRFKLRPRNPDCPVCGDKPSIKELDDTHLGTNTCWTRQPNIPDELALDDESRIAPQDLKSKLSQAGEPILLVDVRSPVELQICGFSDSLNIPISSLQDASLHHDLGSQIRSRLKSSEHPYGSTVVVAVCRRGNDSQLAVPLLRKILQEDNLVIQDLRGGLTAWKKEVNPELPMY